MPCWQINVVSVEFSAERIDVLRDAVRFLGWEMGTTGEVLEIKTPDGVFTIANGEAVVDRSLMPRVNELKRAYAFQAVQRAARANGWQWQGNRNAGKLVRAVR